MELLLTNVGESQGNSDELRLLTGLRRSEEIALVVTDYDAAHGRAACDQSARLRRRQRLYEDRRGGSQTRAVPTIHLVQIAMNSISY